MRRGDEYAGRVRPATKEAQRERAIERIAATTPADLEESLLARREFGPSYGYASTAEWWETMRRTYDLPEDLRPDWVTGEAESAEEDPVLDFVTSYTGDFGFLRSLRDQVASGKTLTERQYQAAARCHAQQTTEVSETDRDDEVVKFVLGYRGSFGFLISLRDQLKRGRSLSAAQRASAERCMGQEVREQSQRAAVTEGMYQKDGVIYKVQRAVNGSGNLYAKKLVRDTGNVFGTVDQGRWKFEYDRGAIRRLTIEDKMTLEQAKKFGALYGTCCVCGRTLTDETSIAEGIGPICAGREWR